MKHPSSRAFFAHWDQSRSQSPAPDRSQMTPEQVRHLLADAFVLGCEAGSGYPFRMAGTRLCALAGRDLKDARLSSLFVPSNEAELNDLIAVVADETLPTVAGVTATAADGTPAKLELLLLPFIARTHTPSSLTGLMVPLDPAVMPLSSLRLASWRHIHPSRLISPRMIRRLNTLRGLTVYEGLR